MFKTEFPMNQTETYMECLIPQKELAKRYLQLASGSGLLGGTAPWLVSVSMAGVGNHQGSLTTLHIKTSPW